MTSSENQAKYTHKEIFRQISAIINVVQLYSRPLTIKFKSTFKFSSTQILWAIERIANCVSVTKLMQSVRRINVDVSGSYDVTRDSKK